MIKQQFNRHLLDPLYGFYMDVIEKLVPFANRKIRPQDVGKRREFDKLLKEYKETYERKKIEKANYEAEIKEKIKKVPRIPSTGETVRFKRMERT